MNPLIKITGVILAFSSLSFGQISDHPNLGEWLMKIRSSGDSASLANLRAAIDASGNDSLEFLYHYFQGEHLYLKDSAYPEAIERFQKSQKIAESREDLKMVFAAKFAIASTYNLMGVTQNGIDILLEAKDLAEAIGDSTQISKSYVVLAGAIGDNKQAIEWYKKSLQYNVQRNRNWLVALVNTGFAYMNLDTPNYDSAIHYLSLANYVRDTSGVISVSGKTTLAEALLLAGQVNEADSLMDLTLKADTLPYEYGRIYAYTIKILISLALEEYLIADKYIESGMKLLESSHAENPFRERFYEASKRVLYKVGDLHRYHEIDSIEEMAEAAALVKSNESNVDRATASYEAGRLQDKIKSGEELLRIRTFLIIVLIFLLIAMMLVGYQQIRKRSLKIQLKDEALKTLRAEQKNQWLDDQMRIERISQQERQLSAHVVNLAQKNDSLAKVLEELSTLKQNFPEISKKLSPLISRVNADLKNSKSWEDLWLHFEKVHPGFYQKLNEEYPELSKQDKRLLGYIKMQLSNKEIAQLLGINYESVNTSRYRIRKKMQLSKDTDLDVYILSL